MKWIRRLLVLVVAVLLVFFFVLLPVGGSFLITNSHFRYPEKGPRNPEDVGLDVEPVEFKTVDSLTLRGWWSSGESGFPVIIFCHGLNRSRLELLERAGEADTAFCFLICEITVRAIGPTRRLGFSNPRMCRRQASSFA
jgi:hypothetical protein